MSAIPRKSFVALEAFFGIGIITACFQPTVLVLQDHLIQSYRHLARHFVARLCQNFRQIFDLIFLIVFRS